MNRQDFIKNIALDIIFTILTFGLFNIWIQYRQMTTVNFMMKYEKYNFFLWFIFCIFSCGLYHLYHEYVMSEDLSKILGRESGKDGLINLLLSLFGLSIVADAIQQYHINEYFSS